MTTYNRISVTEGSITEPVTAAEAKTWLRVDYSDDDTLITGMIKSARQSIEQFTNLALVDKSVLMDVTTTCETDNIRLPYVDSIESVTIEDIDEEAAVDTEDYKIRGTGIKVTYGGYFSIEYDIEASPVPEALKEAIKMEVAERYANRGENNGTEGLSKSAQSKAQSFVQIWL